MQLERLPDFVARRRELAAMYAATLPAAVSAPVEPEGCKTNWQSYCIKLDPELDQKQVMQTMADLGVSVRRGIMCAHREPAYKNTPWRAGSLAHSEFAQDHCLSLPLYHQLTEAEVATVVQVLGQACGC